MNKEWTGIGLMSGTSLDGIDLALCRFAYNGMRWSYSVEKAVTVPYSSEMADRLSRAGDMSAIEYALLDVELGNVFATAINSWLDKNEGVDFVASHGHTVFHQPGRGLTTQIGSGAVIAAKTGLKVVCDFRTKDVALGGQGAPLVPIGDELLFSEYGACLNLGGFANISFNAGGRRVAFDISPCNMALNFLAGRRGLRFDRDGEISSKGIVVEGLLEKLDSLPYYRQTPPKSLGKEWFDENLLPLMNVFLETHCVEDVSRTVAEHVAGQISAAVPEGCATMLATGGGAHNRFLVQLLENKLPDTSIVVPDALTVDYKEALVFAFLGLLRIEEKNNTLRSVTGATENSVGGCVYL